MKIIPVMVARFPVDRGVRTVAMTALGFGTRIDPCECGEGVTVEFFGPHGPPEQTCHNLDEDITRDKVEQSAIQSIVDSESIVRAFLN